MSSTNKTTNYNLPIFVDDDTPTWLGDWNDAMNKIDEAIKEASMSGGTTGAGDTTTPFSITAPKGGSLTFTEQQDPSGIVTTHDFKVTFNKSTNSNGLIVEAADNNRSIELFRMTGDGWGSTGTPSINKEVTLDNSPILNVKQAYPFTEKITFTHDGATYNIGIATGFPVLTMALSDMSIRTKKLGLPKVFNGVTYYPIGQLPYTYTQGDTGYRSVLGEIERVNPVRNLIAKQVMYQIYPNFNLISILYNFRPQENTIIIYSATEFEDSTTLIMKGTPPNKYIGNWSPEPSN